MFRAVLNVLFWLVIGVGALVFGVADLTGNPLYTWNGTITCDNEVMAPGDVCVQAGQPVESGRTYEEMLAGEIRNQNDPNMPYYEIGAGLVMVSIGAFMAYRLRNRRRRLRGAYG